MRARKNSRARGFTLLELMVVMSILLILVSIAAPMYQQQIKHARESVLRQDLFTLRTLISQYTLDKQKAPQSLEDLMQAGYLKQIPVDPISGQADWTVDQAQDTISSPDQQDEGDPDEALARVALGDQERELTEVGDADREVEPL